MIDELPVPVSAPKKKRRSGSATKLRLIVEHVMEARGLHVKPVEHFDAYSRRRVDLYGVFDLLGLSWGPGGLVGVQVTPAGRLSDHVRLLGASEDLRRWLSTGARAEVWSLRLVRTRWYARVFEVKLLKSTVIFEETEPETAVARMRRAAATEGPAGPEGAGDNGDRV